MHPTTPSLHRPTASLPPSAPSREVQAGVVLLAMLVPVEVAEKLADYGAPHGLSAGQLAAETLTEKWAPHLSELGALRAA